MNQITLAERRAPVVKIADGTIFADSRDVAAFFERRHGDVLASIDNLIKSEASLALRNFRQGVYILAETGSQQHRLFEMDRDGFSLLAMGFTGAKALKWKIDYIAAFNAMEAALKKVPATYDWMRAVVDNMEAQGQRLFSVEKTVEKISGAIENFGAHETYRSIKAHAGIIGRKINTAESGKLGMQASALSKRLGYTIGRQPDDAFGTVGSYHIDILKQVFAA